MLLIFTILKRGDTLFRNDLAIRKNEEYLIHTKI